MLIILFLIEFFNRKVLFPGSLKFLCLLYFLIGCLFQCVVSFFYRVSRRLNIRVRCDSEIHRLVLYDLADVQVVLNLQSPGRLENLFY